MTSQSIKTRKTLVAVIIFCGLASFFSPTSSSSLEEGNFPQKILHRASRQVIFPNTRQHQVSNTRPVVSHTQTRRTQISNSVSNGQLLPARCGMAHSSFKITNGEVAMYGEYPWIAALGYRGIFSRGLSWKCAGTLINNRYVVTAAHCLHRSSNPDTLITVRLGEHDLVKSPDCTTARNGRRFCTPSPEDYNPERQILHPQYDPSNIRNDIAIIRLHRDVRYSAYIQPACIPDPSQLRQYPRWATVAGWGNTEHGILSNVLRKTALPFVDNNSCTRIFGHQVHDGQLCYGGHGGRDSCDGDSGGPLLVPSKNRGPPFYLLGIVSYGKTNCGEPGIPAVYTDVSKYKKWIESNIHR